LAKAYFAHWLKSGRFDAQKFAPPRTGAPLNFAVTTLDLVIVKRVFGQFEAAACSQAFIVTPADSSLLQDLVPLHLEYDSFSLPGQAVRVTVTTQAACAAAAMAKKHAAASVILRTFI
jgi:hypothetical protein